MWLHRKLQYKIQIFCIYCIVQGYGLDDPGFNSRQDLEIFSSPKWGPPSFLYSGYYDLFAGVNQLRRAVNHSGLSRGEVKHE
jgi:hypothetical protein